jgi:preprotein translocase subunit SecG
MSLVLAGLFLLVTVFLACCLHYEEDVQEWLDERERAHALASKPEKKD